MTRRMQAVLTACLGVGIAILPQAANAQAVYGSVYGTVTDASGAAIPGATVTITDEAKGTSVTAKSNESGAYSVEHLIPDLYTVKVEMTGFKTFETNHLQLLADTSPKVDAAMQTGGASETVNVNADAIPQLKTDRADVATTFDQKTVADLPVSGRNFTSLQLLLPGAQQLGWSHAADENPQASQQIQIDGQAFGGTAFELDGTDNQDPILGIIVVNPALDAVSESKIATQNFDAEFGKAVSAVVTAQTKSGTNNFHGSAYDYRRSNANLARNPFSQNPSPADPTRVGNLIPGGLYNEFGGSVGGPIKKDRAFFFGDYQGQRQRAGTSGTQTVPTTLLMNTCLGAQTGPSGIQGCDFSQYAQQQGAGGVIYDPTTGKPFPGNVIPTNRLSPQALALFKLLQPYAPNTAPNGAAGTTGLAGNYSASGQGIFNADQWDARVDMQVTQKIHAFGRFSRFTDTLTGATIFGAAGGTGFGLANYGGTSVGANDSFAGGADMAINATLLTDFRLGYYRYNAVTSKYDQGEPFTANLGIPDSNLDAGFTSGASAFNIEDPGRTAVASSTQGSGVGPQYGSGLNVNRCNCPLSQREDQYQIVNNWTKIIANHSIKFGADLRYARNLRVPSDVNRAGQFNIGVGPTSNPADQTGGLGFATFVLGDVTNYQRYASTSTNAKEFQKRVFFYAQDTYRATPNLTLNLGVRYELYFPETVNGHQGNGALMIMNSATDTTGFLQVAGYGNIGSNMGYSPSYKAISPRIGAAYQLNPQTVLRAGYGRSFDLGVFGSLFGHTATQNLPILTNQSIAQPSGPNSFAFTLAQGPGLPPVTPVPASGLLPNPGFNVTSKARPNSLRLPTIDAWNLSIQRSITPTLSVTMAYVGNKGTHTLSAGDGNSTNPNEAAIFLPSQFSINGQSLHYTTATAEGSATPNALGIYPDNGTNNSSLLQRYYAGSLPACQSPNYTQPTLAGLPAGACGWNTNIQYNGDDQDTHFNALQLSIAKQFTKGLTFNANYAWQRSINFGNTYSTWIKRAQKGRDDSQRENQIVAYGSYELPFGRNHLVGGNAPGIVNEVIGGWQISPIVTYASGLPFSLSYQECSASVPGSAPCYPNGHGNNLKLNIQKLNTTNHNRLAFHGATVPLTQQAFNGFTASSLDEIGTTGRNSNFGPNYFNTDLAVQKNFPIHESLFAQFRMDAYNAFNHMSLGNPGGSIDNGDQNIGGLFGSQFPTRQLQFSVRLQF
jgi:outer membrane receptor protein involved in Fe transport